ncbi:glycoside hydrolase family 13 protein [Flavobacterium sp.]|uniref:glycoside hydrolase family 13 protein n=1 Tax=Flavobacterium sp. TaxID=239 RepID=UPI00262DA69B|nr:glycoside hydrolase family 13 protein [Flavobacterium sp.]
MKKILLLLTLFSFSTHSQIKRIEPSNWWIGMHLNEITLLVYGDAINSLEPSIQYKGVSITKVDQVENPNYLFITVNINQSAEPGKVKINFKKNDKLISTKEFPLLSREKESANRASFTQKDAILLIVPDRFANDNPKNDNAIGYLEKANRTNESGRHGGDIQGIINRLDYIQSLGYTQIWNTPLVENNMPKYSYHGYAATDFYKIDSRFGTNDDFKKLVTEAKKRNIGLIWDVVLNHCGLEYYFVKDLPTNDWLNFQETKTKTNHIKSTQLDKYAIMVDKNKYTDGWFDDSMPDLNQRNPFVASFLIQNSIWWIEYAGLSGIREDTFSYSDKDFLAKWTKAILEEYPNFNIVGEEMTTVTELAAYWQKDKVNADGYKCYLPTLMDFSLTENLVKSLTTTNNWWSTWKEVYQGIGQDYIYPNPNNLLIFPDNHDLDRFYSKINKDFEHWKIAMVLYATMRGIPQFYYGTELLYSNEVLGNDGQRRADFYGGWQNDSKDAITKKGLTENEQKAQQFFSTLLNWRKSSNAIHTGKFKHYAPNQNDVYVYFRYTDKEKVMVILNKNKEKVTLDMKHFEEMIPSSFNAIDVMTNTKLFVNNTLDVEAKSALILEIK